MAKPKRVVIVGMIEAYADTVSDDEVWGVNCAYWHQKDLTRLYFFDPLEQWPTERSPEDFYREVNALGIPVVTRAPIPEIPRSVALPVEDMVREFGVCYFASTICYMLAHAIYEGFDEIVLHKIHVVPSCMKYADQKACLDFWCGMALGRGIRLSMGTDVRLARPYPWDTPLYGYLRGNVVAMSVGLMQRAHTLSLLPAEFTPVGDTAAVAERVMAVPSARVCRYSVPATEVPTEVRKRVTSLTDLLRRAKGKNTPGNAPQVLKGAVR